MQKIFFITIVLIILSVISSASTVINEIVEPSVLEYIECEDSTETEESDTTVEKDILHVASSWLFSSLHSSLDISFFLNYNYTKFHSHLKPPIFS